MLQREGAGIIPAPPLEIDVPKAALSHPLPERKDIGPHGTYPVENPSADPCSKEERCKLFISGSNIDFHRYARGQETTKQKELKKEGASIEPSPGPQMTAFLKKEVPEASTYLREVLVDPAMGGGAGAWRRACPDDPKADCVVVPPKWEEEALTYNTDPAAQSIGQAKGKPTTRAEWRFTTRQMLTHEAAHARFTSKPSAGMPKFDGTLTRETISYKELSELFAQLSEFPLFYEEGMSGEATRPEKLRRVRQLYADRYLQRTMKITEDIPGILLRLRCLNSCSEVDTMLGNVLRSVTQGWPAEVSQALKTILTDPSLALHWPAPPQPRVDLVPEPEGLRFQENPLRRKPATSSFLQSEPLDGLVGAALEEGSQPLSPATRAYMEPRFGYDFSQVRVHTGERAAQSARSVNALAYTLGQDVVFGAGQYGPATESGQKLLAHELAHVLQQQAAIGSTRPLEIGVGDPNDSCERRADLDSHQDALRISQPREADEWQADAAVNAVSEVRALSALGRSDLYIARKPNPNQAAKGKSEEDKTPPVDTMAGALVSQIIVSLSQNRVAFKTSKGSIGGDADTDLTAGSYELKPDVAKRKWVIEKPAVKVGLRFNVDLEGAVPWTLAYPEALPLTVMSGPLNTEDNKAPEVTQGLAAPESEEEKARKRAEVQSTPATDIREKWAGKGEAFLAVASDPTNTLNAAQTYQIWLRFWMDKQGRYNAEFKEIEKKMRAALDPSDYVSKRMDFDKGKRNALGPEFEAADNRKNTTEFLISHVKDVHDWLETYVDVMHRHVTLQQVNEKALEIAKAKALFQQYFAPIILGAIGLSLESPGQPKGGVKAGAVAEVEAAETEAAGAKKAGPKTDATAAPPKGSPPTGGGGGPAPKGARILIVGAETEAEFAYARERAAAGQRVDVVNPRATAAADAYSKEGGNFTKGKIESLPKEPVFDLIREDFPYPTGKTLTTIESVSERLSRLKSGGRWVIVTEEVQEFLPTLESAARSQGAKVTTYPVPAAHEGTPQSSYPKAHSRSTVIVEKP